MLKRIAIHNYKSFVDLDLELKPLTVLLGPNSAGKSNFLDALQLLSRMVTKPTLKEAFEPPYRGTPLESVSFIGEGVPDLLQRESATFRFEIDVELSPQTIEQVNRLISEMRSKRVPDDEADTNKITGKQNYITRKYLRYALKIEITPKSGIVRVVDEYLAALNSRWEPIGKPLPFIALKGNRLHLRMEGQAHPTYYETHLDHTILSRPLYPPHYPHLVAMRQELANWFIFYFEPRERMRAANPVKEVKGIGLMGEDLAAFLNTLQSIDKRQFEAIERSLHMIIPSITGIRATVNNLGEVELSVREGNVSVPARILSEGTLRILGLLALGGMKDPPTLIGFEEPENGIHPRRIQVVTDLLQTMASGSTQLVLTSHSPVLSDLIPDDSLFVCRKEDGRTEITSFSVWGAFARPAGIQHALDSDEEQELVSQRLLRGDFDA